MNRQTLVFERLKKIIIEQLEVAPDAVTPQANFFNDLNADHLDGVELVMAVEEEFDIEIPDEAAECIATVQQAVDYIANKCPPDIEKIHARIELIADYWTKLDISEEEAIDLTRKAFNVIENKATASKRKELIELRAKLKAADAEVESIKAKIKQREKDLE